MQAYEKLGLFYLGKRFDLERGTRQSDLVLYDSKDLVTHAVCVGMTGSGKTGLGIAMIEEAAIDGVPVLAIDPKGDLANLLLTFPTLEPSEFLPWIDPAEAAAHQSTPEAWAAKQAEQWKSGLAEWDEQPERIARLRAAADVRVFTPGSRAGTPLALLKSLRAAGAEDDEDAAARVTSSAAGLLALAGVEDAGPQGREQALIAAILSNASADAPADLPWLVQQIQRPSFDRIGVLDLETFYPAKERQALALRFNSVLAAPNFKVWLEGAPLDPASLLFTPEGKPRVAIVSIAHLDDAQRMLVVTLLLNAILEWTRRQSGTGSLRALIYMDEVFGYLPPVANPPSKLPLLTLLKQARAFGVGLMLATQNPVDLDYKALSNIGTWFLGKLQTERDKARVLDGLQSIGGMDRGELDRTLSALRSRVFLMHNVHEHEPVVFETRWTLSYLRGPIGRDELRRLAGSPAHDAAAQARPAITDAPPAAPVEPTSSARGDAAGGQRPIVPAGIREVFLHGDGGRSEFEPVLYAAARVHYTDTKRSIDETADVIATVPFDDGAVAVNWDDATPSDEAPETLGTDGPPGSYHRPPAEALDPKRYAAWSREFVQWIMRSRPLQVMSSPAAGLTSSAGESERDFRIRLQQRTRESRDAAVEKLRTSYAPKLARLTDKVRQAQEVLGREQQQAQQQKLQTAVSFGATLLGAVMGRKAVSLSTLGRATTAARGVSRSVKESEDVSRAEARLAEAQQQLQQMQTEIDDQIAALTGDTAAASIDKTTVPAKRTNIEVRLIALAWRPVEHRPAMPATPRT